MSFISATHKRIVDAHKAREITTMIACENVSVLELLSEHPCNLELSIVTTVNEKMNWLWFSL